MKTKHLALAVALAIGTSATFAQECTGIAPCQQAEQPDTGKRIDLLEKAKGFLGGIAGSVSKGSAALAESLKDKSDWPTVAESSSVQLFPAYGGPICVRRSIEMGDAQEAACLVANEKLRGTYYRFIALAPEAEVRMNHATVTGPGWREVKDANVVVMPAILNSVTCWPRDVEGNGPKECQALRPILKDMPFKYVVIPDAAKLREIAKFNASMK